MKLGEIAYWIIVAAIIVGVVSVCASEPPSKEEPDRIPYRCYFWIEDKECVDELPDDDSFEEVIRRCSTDVLFDVRIPPEGDVRPHVHLDDSYHCSQGVSWTTSTDRQPGPHRIFTVHCKYPIWGMICWEDPKGTLAFPERERNCGYAGAKARKVCMAKPYGGDETCDAEAKKAVRKCIAPSIGE